MNEQQNRDDLVKRIIDHKQENERREMTTEEKRKVVDYVKKEILPRAYAKDNE